MSCKNTSLPYLSLALITLLSLAQTSRAQDAPQDYLNVHNAARSAVGLSLLTWDDTLTSFALNYANQRAGSGDCSLVHSGGPYGENLAWGSPDLSGSDAVTMWVNERDDYDYNSNTCAPDKQCGHYTQVVWRDTARVGCAKVRCANGDGSWVGCNYDPRGNINNQKPY